MIMMIMRKLLFPHYKIEKKEIKKKGLMRINSRDYPIIYGQITEFFFSL
jgi:hypothetical protein